VGKSFYRKIPPILMLLFTFFLMGVSITVIGYTKGDRTYQSFLYKPSTMDYVIEKASVEYVPHILNGITIYVPKSGNQCFNHPLPCSPGGDCLDCLEMRGKSIKDGFRTKK
jgi:ABC-type uncharacterized transport system permease subunit